MEVNSTEEGAGGKEWYQDTQHPGSSEVSRTSISAMLEVEGPAGKAIEVVLRGGAGSHSDAPVGTQGSEDYRGLGTKKLVESEQEGGFWFCLSVFKLPRDRIVESWQSFQKHRSPWVTQNPAHSSGQDPKGH